MTIRYNGTLVIKPEGRMLVHNQCRIDLLYLASVWAWRPRTAPAPLHGFPFTLCLGLTWEPQHAPSLRRMRRTTWSNYAQPGQHGGHMATTCMQLSPQQLF